MSRPLAYFSSARLPEPPPAAGGADSFVAFRSARIILSSAPLASCSASTCDYIARMTFALIGAPEAERVGVDAGGFDSRNVTGLVGCGTMLQLLRLRGRSSP